MSTRILTPLISVIIPTKDRIEDLNRALESVGQQTYTNIEVVVVDDASAEELQPTFDRFTKKYPAIRLISHKNSIPFGGGYCRNLGTQIAMGEFICFLDDDDLYLPNKLKLLEAYLRDKPEVDAVFGRVIIRENTDSLINYKQYNAPLRDYLSEVCKLQTNGSLVRRRSFERANFNPALKKYQDTQFHVELSKKANVHLIESPVAIWHKNYSAAQVSSVNSTSKHASIEKFLILIEYLLSLHILSDDEIDFFFRKELKYYAEYGLYSKGLVRLRGRRLGYFISFNAYCLYYAVGMNKIKNSLGKTNIRKK